MSKTQDVLTHLSKSLGECRSFYSTQYKASEDALQFWSGRQFSDEEIKERRVNMRPELQELNETRVMVNSIVNPFRKAQNSVQVSIPDSDASYIINGLIRKIEKKSEAQEAYEVAFENAVVGGIGWVVLTTDYASEKSLEQTVKICKVDDLRTVMIDPASNSITGSDANYAIVLNYLPKEEVESLYGEEYCNQVSGVNVYKKWYIPKGMIPVITFYRKTQKNIKRWFFQDGTFIDQREKPLVPFIGSRVITANQVEVYKIINDQIVDENLLPIDSIPVVPFYGDRVYREDVAIKWVGAVEWMKPAQRLINEYYNSEREIIRNSPISPWLATKEQVQGLEKYWSRANRTAFDTLVYNFAEGQGAPQRMDANPQTQASQTGRVNAHADLQRVTGIYDSQLGQSAGSPEQSGVALALRDSFGDRTNVHYYQNAQKSLEQVGYILVQLLKHTYSESQRMTIKNEFGEYEEVEANVAELLNSVENLEVDVVIGTMAESKRKQDLQILQGVGDLLPEDKKTLFLDLMIDSLETQNKQIIKQRIKPILPPEAQEKEESAIPPEAQQALDSATQTIEQLEQNEQLLKQYIAQLQMQLQALEKDSEAMLVKAQMDNSTKIQVEAMKQEGENQRAIAKILEDQEKRFDAKIEKLLSKFEVVKPTEVYDDSTLKTDLEGRQF